MKTKITHSANHATMNIKTDTCDLDVLLTDGVDMGDSLRQSASAYRRQAARLVRMADLCEAAAVAHTRPVVKQLTDGTGTGRMSYSCVHGVSVKPCAICFPRSKAGNA